MVTRPVALRHSLRRRAGGKAAPNRGWDSWLKRLIACRLGCVRGRPLNQPFLGQLDWAMNLGMSRYLRSGTKRGLPYCLALLCTLSAAQAGAQTDEQRSGARAIATEGASAFKAGRYQEAVDLFAKAESLVHAPPHLLFLARSHAKLGQLVKAREAYLKIVKEQLPANAPVAFRDAQSAAADELKAVEPHIGALQVNLTGAENARDLVLTIDGQPVSSVLVGVAQPIDPGEHQIAAHATGLRAAPASVTIHDAERQSITLALLADPTSVAPIAPLAPGSAPLAVPPPAATDHAAPPMTQAPAADTSAPGNGLKVGAYVAFGVGAVGLGVGTLFALRSKSKRSDADKADAQLEPRCPCSVDDPDAKNVASLDDAARSAKTLSIVGFALGGAGVATGVTLLVLSTHKSEAPQGASVQPWFGLGSAGLRGSF